MGTAAQTAFVQWLERHGGYVHVSVDLFAPLPNGDRGVVATKPIKEGDQLLIVPRSLCLTMSAEAGPSADSPALRAIEGMKLSPFLSMVLYMLAERALVSWQGLVLRPLCAWQLRTLDSATRCWLPSREQAFTSLPGMVQGDKSLFAPYFNTLPARHDCLLAWTEEERAELAGTGTRCPLLWEGEALTCVGAQGGDFSVSDSTTSITEWWQTG